MRRPVNSASAVSTHERALVAARTATHHGSGAERQRPLRCSSDRENERTRPLNTHEGAERLEAVRALVDEQTRLGMLVGVAVGFELARELQASENDDTPIEES